MWVNEQLVTRWHKELLVEWVGVDGGDHTFLCNALGTGAWQTTRTPLAEYLHPVFKNYTWAVPGKDM